MRTPSHLSLISIVFLLLIGMSNASCDWFKEKVKFSGKVVSGKGEPVAEAEVNINDKKVRTEKDGSFTVSVAQKEKDDYQVTVRKKGYGLFSRKYTSAFEEKLIRLTKGTIITFDPTKDTVIRDAAISESFSQSGLLQFDTARLFDLVPKVYNASGQVIDLGYPANLENVFDYVSAPTVAPQGISITIRANSFVDANGNLPSGQLQVALSTVDFFNPDGMPGDFLVRQENRLSSMESFGAGTVQIFDDRQSYQLKKGGTAKVSIPVYPIRQQLKEKLPQSLDLLYFNEKSGFWERGEEKGYYNEKTNSYEAEVKHFSTINMDVVISGNSGCLKFRQMTDADLFLPSYKVHVIVPPWGPYAFKEKVDVPVIETSTTGEYTGCVRHNVGPGKSTGLHPILRIPFDDNPDPNIRPYIVLIFSGDHDNNAGTADQPIDIAIVEMGGSSIDPTPLLTGMPDCIEGGVNKSDCAACGDGPASSVPTDNCNTCWQGNCAFVPFERTPTPCQAIAYSGYASPAVKVKIKWTVDPALTTIEEFWIRECNAADCPVGCNTTVANACDVETAPAGTLKKIPFTMANNVFEVEYDYLAADIGTKKTYLIEGLEVTGTSIDTRIVKLCTGEVTIQ
jgi:hypothetical protein